MSFLDVLTAPQSLPFSLSLLLFFVITLVEIVLVWLGAGSDFGLDINLDLDTPDPAAGGWLLDWLGIGRVPYLVSLAAFLFIFGMLGLVFQDIQFEVIGTALPWPIVAMGCGMAALPALRYLNRGLGRIWPKEIESTAVSQDSLVGHEAVVVLGQITQSELGQIKMRDSNGTLHYGLALADSESETYASGDRLLIVGRRGAHFLVIRHPNPISMP